MIHNVYPPKKIVYEVRYGMDKHGHCVEEFAEFPRAEAFAESLPPDDIRQIVKTEVVWESHPDWSFE